MSTAGGVQTAPSRGKAIEADAIQIFTANQNQWSPRQPTGEESAGFREQMKSNGLSSAVSHASYLLNMGSPEPAKLAMSRRAFAAELARCEACAIPFVVFHPGAHMNGGEEPCLKRIAEGIDHCLSESKSSTVTILIENTAGQGTAVGHSFDQLTAIVDGVKNRERVGICFDTQHAFAAGHDIRTEAGWRAVLDTFDRAIGINAIGAFHLNDSKRELGSRVDRHENIGKGLLTMETFWFLVNEERFRDIPMIVETPADDDSVYAEELGILRKLIGAKRPKGAN